MTSYKNQLLAFIGLIAISTFLILLFAIIFKPLEDEDQSSIIKPQYQDDSIELRQKLDSLNYVNKVKDSIIYDLYQDNLRLKGLL